MNHNLLATAILLAAAAVGASVDASRSTAAEHTQESTRIGVIGENSSDSLCADDRKSALCAVEEFIACWVQTPSHSCGNRPVTIILDMGAWASLGHADSVEYSVQSVHEFNPGDLAEKRPRAHLFPAGSIEIVLRQRLLPGVQTAPEWQTGYYVLTRDNDEWRILDYSFAPWPDPWVASRRWMSQSESSSSCIGDTGDAICSVETLIACWLRRDGALCRKVIDCGENDVTAALCRLPGEGKSRLDPALPWPKHSLEYFVVEVRDPARPELAPPGVPAREIWLRQYFLGPDGDRYRLVPDGDLPGLPAAPGPGYWVTLINGQWRVTGWGGELDD